MTFNVPSTSSAKFIRCIEQQLEKGLQRETDGTQRIRNAVTAFTNNYATAPCVQSTLNKVAHTPTLSDLLTHMTVQTINILMKMEQARKTFR
jgi:hypothetical protein